MISKILLISLVIFFTICSRSWALPECEGSPKNINNIKDLSSWNECIGSYIHSTENFKKKFTGEWKDGKTNGQGTFYNSRCICRTI